MANGSVLTIYGEVEIIMTIGDRDIPMHAMVADSVRTGPLGLREILGENQEKHSNAALCMVLVEN